MCEKERERVRERILKTSDRTSTRRVSAAVRLRWFFSFEIDIGRRKGVGVDRQCELIVSVSFMLINQQTRRDCIYMCLYIFK